MESHFASAFRSSHEEILVQSEDLHPVVGELLDAVGGMLAILNEHRQILAMNVGLMRRLGLDDPCPSLGLRPGEALGCVHAHEEPSGCGTTKWCRTCGAAIAMVTSLVTDTPVEQVCAMDVQTPSGTNELSLRVRCSPLERGGRRFLVLFLQDITQDQKLAILEKTFFHDVKGLVTGILGASEMLRAKVDGSSAALTDSLRRMSLRLANELTLQSRLAKGDAPKGLVRYTRTKVSDLIQDLRDEVDHFPLYSKRVLEYPQEQLETELFTDAHIVVRILKNMVVNALEASVAGEAIRVGFRLGQDGPVFTVWNERVIDPDVAMRVFQRNFSTKGQIGRGLGTWSMKFFGEQILRGRVSFRTAPGEGTTFQLELPASPEA
jgi:hypothetical protein